jgi:hypothetical protein
MRKKAKQDSDVVFLNEVQIMIYYWCTCKVLRCLFLLKKFCLEHLFY